MRLQQAVSHLKRRLEKCESFRPNNKDKKAYNTLVEHIKDSKKKAWIHNQLFAKLYLIELREQLLKFRCEITDPCLQKYINRYLDKPITYYIEELTDLMNIEEMHNVSSRIEAEGGINNLSDERVEYYRNEMRIAGNRFSFQEVEMHLQQIITEALRKFS